MKRARGIYNQSNLQLRNKTCGRNNDPEGGASIARNYWFDLFPIRHAEAAPESQIRKLWRDTSML
ncbi:hypothetical protein GGR38_004166 [Novosphingobium sediminicola]|uniref:Uncharacterized protein n=1 Tax=Novosphingobium sediminicola TaxID=563162 RepID=A0A7W6G9L7_9SPHN|nr:hypothetical protein [Novosphingobium sediminicola]